HLLRFLGAQRGRYDRLRFAAGEQRRAMGARKEAHRDFDRPDGLRIAAVDAAAFLEDCAANDVGLDRLDDLGRDKLLLRVSFGERGRRFLARGGERGLALLLVGELVGGLDVLADEVLELLLDRRLVGRLRQLPRLLGGLLGELDDRLDHLLALAVGEHDGAEHLLLGQLLGFGFDHHHRIAGAGDDQVEVAFGDLALRRVEDILTVLEADARGADRAHEGYAGKGEGGARRDHREDVGLVLAVVGEDLRDHQDLVVEPLREQRPDRPVDEAAGQRLLFGRSALALEEAAGDPAGSGEFLLIVDGQREEVLPGLHRLGGGDCAQHHGFAEGRENRAVGLAGNAARFELEGLSTPLDFNCFGIEHLLSFTRGPDAGGTASAGYPACSGSGRLVAPLRPAELRDFALLFPGEGRGPGALSRSY